MPDHRMHLQFPGCSPFVHSEMDLDLRSYGVLYFGQDAYADGAHVCQEAGRKLPRVPEQHSPVGGPSRAASAFR